MTHAAQRTGSNRASPTDLKDALWLTLDIQLCLTEPVTNLLSLRFRASPKRRLACFEKSV